MLVHGQRQQRAVCNVPTNTHNWRTAKHTTPASSVGLRTCIRDGMTCRPSAHWIIGKRGTYWRKRQQSKGETEINSIEMQTDTTTDQTSVQPLALDQDVDELEDTSPFLSSVDPYTGLVGNAAPAPCTPQLTTTMSYPPVGNEDAPSYSSTMVRWCADVHPGLLFARGALAHSRALRCCSPCRFSPLGV